MPSAVVVSAVRTPYGRPLGALAELKAPEIGAAAAAEALHRIGLNPGKIDRVYLGNVCAHALRGNPAAAAWDRVEPGSGAACLTVRAGCASGLEAVILAMETIAAGAAEAVLAGGFESPSNAPHLAFGLRRGLRLGGGNLQDGARHDGPAGVPAGGEKDHTPRPAAGRVSLRTAGIIPVEVPASKKRPARVIDADQEVGEPAHGGQSAPPLADGAAALVIVSEAFARREKLEVLARLHAAAPPYAGELAASRLVEADVTAAWESRLAGAGGGAGKPVVNSLGGGWQIGHAAGADGARLLVGLIHALQEDSGGKGLAIAAGAWGETAGVMVEV